MYPGRLCRGEFLITSIHFSAAMAGRPALTLSVTGHASNAQAYTNCAYVHPSDLAKLADAAGQPIETVSEKGLICSVGEAVFTVR